MQKEVSIEKPNPLTISYNLEQTISKLKEIERECGFIREKRAI